MPSLYYRNDNKALPVKKGQRILDALLRNGVEYPHSCRSGQCGHCKGKLHSGDIKRDPCDPHALSNAEADAGYFLACCSRAMSDVNIEWTGEASETLTARVFDAERLSNTVTRLFIEPQQALNFFAGQYAQLQFADLPARPYSMANAPGTNLLEFHIRKVEGGRVSNYLYDELPINTTVEITGPLGTSCIKQLPDTPVVLYATGTGLAPMLSIVRELRKQGFSLPVYLYTGARREQDFYYLDQLSALENSFDSLHLELVSQHPSSSVRHGDIADIIFSDISDPEKVCCFLAGSPTIVQKTREALVAKGLNRETIYSDEFTHQSTLEPYPPTVSAPQARRWFNFSLFKS